MTGDEWPDPTEKTDAEYMDEINAADAAFWAEWRTAQSKLT